ncbi:hypothetical protein EJB05_11334 [Eragrostis curvula]|uniref:Nuclear transcription factor Y subunit n=1 Tax=Eragrostis curvula TaxID=38414 RepID=A0A5J9VR25_9POAL|nr:hypothetical protein EJB05_11334 [Eragrostis curvula]
MEDRPVCPVSKSNSVFLSGNGYQMKQGHKANSRDSSSESGWSHQGASAMSESSLNEHTTAQSDSTDHHGKHDQNMMKSVLSLGKQEAAFLPQKLEYNSSFASVPYAADAYYGEVFTGYSPPAIVHPPQNGISSSPVPLPVEPAAVEPIFVNAKQYHAILRRREIRAKLEAQNKLVKDRKPYLHESRHQHAMKRARGSGGRFLNTKQLQEQNQQHQASGGSSSTQATGQNVCSQNGSTHTPPTPAPPSVTSLSRANQDRSCFPSVGFRPTMNFSAQGGRDTKLVANGMQHVVSMR